MSDFRLIASSKANGQILTEKYHSDSSGLTVIISQVEGPLVNGYFCLATEAEDDDGLPHTLEHLIFLGSESYPFKGVLDLLSNRCLSSGTNAWTDTDHTCYTMTTAGSEGFLSLMPVYVDHILYPTLTESGFVTEVHHITGEGEDGGVVYCEMQGCENTGENIVNRELLRAIYPPGCGYRCETGGIMKNLRESTTNEKVINYHKSFYRPDNLALIITGVVKPEDVFKSLEVVQEKIKSKGALPEYKRPWQSPVPDFTSSVDLDVPYPEDEEENGLVCVAWRGPACTTEVTTMLSVILVLEYLTESAISPLQACFVEVDDPLASGVTYSFIENSVSTFYLKFKNVPIAKIDLIENRLKQELDSIINGKVAWDSGRMDTVINRRIQEQMSQIENSPHDSVASMVIGDVLYGSKEQDFETRLNSVAVYESFKKETSFYWLNLIKKYMVDKPRVLVKGKPSIKLESEMKKNEKERVAAQVADLGPQGLEEQAKLVDKSMEENDKDVPEDVLKCVPIPSADSISLHDVQTFTSVDSEESPHTWLKLMPMYTKFNQIKSQFIYFHVVVNLSQLPKDLVMYLPLLLELVGESPMDDGNGNVTAYEKVVAQLEEDFVVASSSVGIYGGRFRPGAFPHTAIMYFQAEPQKYATSVDWMYRLMHHTKIDQERVKIIATKMENSIAEMKRSGSSLSKVLLNCLVFDNDNIINSVSFINQQTFLKDLLKTLNDDSSKTIENLETLMAKLAQPENMSVHISADVENIKKYGCPLSPWKVFGIPAEQPNHSSNHLKGKENFGMKGCGDQHVIYPLGGCESSYLVRCCNTISDPRHQDLPALLLYLQYINQLEGPMWRQIRGAGYAYGYAMYPVVSKGLLYLTLYRATNPSAAFAEAKKIALTSLLDGDEIDDALFESAAPSLIFELIEKEKTISDVVAESLIGFFQQTDRKYQQEFLKRVTAVTKEEMKEVGLKYIKPLFDESVSRTVVVCSSVRVAEIQQEFKGFDVNLTKIDSLDKFK